MKILRIVSSGYEQGGVENGIIFSNRLLAAHGHEVKVISSNARPDLAHYSDYEFSEIPIKGLKKNLYTVFNYSAYKTTKEVLRNFEPDIVITHTMYQPTAAVFMLLRNYTTLAFVHGPEIYTRTLLPWCLSKDDYKNQNYQLNDLTFIGRLHYLYYRYLCGFFYYLGAKNINNFISLSTYTQRLLESEGKSSLYMPNGVNILNVSKSKNSKKSILLYAGRLIKYKGIDDLIKAMPEVLESSSNAILQIAGEGESEYLDELKELCSRLSITSSVRFLGQQNQKQLAELYRNCSIFVLPTTWPETFGKVGVEAMSASKPVIATDVGGVRDWLDDGHNGFLVSPGQPEQIAEKAKLLLTDRILALKMGKAARRTAEEFSMEKMVENLEKILFSSL